MAQIELSDDEARFVTDILQMYMEGIDAEIPHVVTQTDETAHWSLYGLRKQYEVAMRLRLRIATTIGALSL
jgi:hypothetical protein